MGTAVEIPCCDCRVGCRARGVRTLLLQLFDLAGTSGPVPGRPLRAAGIPQERYWQSVARLPGEGGDRGELRAIPVAGAGLEPALDRLLRISRCEEDERVDHHAGGRRRPAEAREHRIECKPFQGSRPQLAICNWRLAVEIFRSVAEL